MNDQWTDRLSDYIDGELAGDELHAIEEHLEGCESCRGILAELRRVIARADALPDHAPSEDLWTAIAARIEEQPVEIPAPRRAPRTVMRSGESAGRRTVVLPVPQLIAACLVVMVISAAAGWSLRPSGGDDTRPVQDGVIVAQPEQSTRVAIRPMDDGLWQESGNELAAVRWEEAVRDQELVYRQMKSQIDTTTVRVLEKNLGLLDQSIDEIREARDEDPENPLWNNRLADSLRRKLRLLRWASSISTRET
jgi:negative regulator of sigma E activity